MHLHEHIKFHHSYHAPPTSEPTKNYLNQQQHHPQNHKKIIFFMGVNRGRMVKLKEEKKKTTLWASQFLSTEPPNCSTHAFTLSEAVAVVDVAVDSTPRRRRYHAPPRDSLHSRLHAAGSRRCGQRPLSPPSTMPVAATVAHVSHANLPCHNTSRASLKP